MTPGIYGHSTVFIYQNVNTNPTKEMGKLRWRNIKSQGYLQSCTVVSAAGSKQPRSSNPGHVISGGWPTQKHHTAKEWNFPFTLGLKSYENNPRTQKHSEPRMSCSLASTNIPRDAVPVPTGRGQGSKWGRLVSSLCRSLDPVPPGRRRSPGCFPSFSYLKKKQNSPHSSHVKCHFSLPPDNKFTVSQ